MRVAEILWLRRVVLIPIVLATPLALGGCITVTREPPPPSTTIVLPQGSTAVCANGSQPPC